MWPTRTATASPRSSSGSRNARWPVPPVRARRTRSGGPALTTLKWPGAAQRQPHRRRPRLRVRSSIWLVPVRPSPRGRCRLVSTSRFLRLEGLVPPAGRRRRRLAIRHRGLDQPGGRLEGEPLGQRLPERGRRHQRAGPPPSDRLAGTRRPAGLQLRSETCWSATGIDPLANALSPSVNQWVVSSSLTPEP